MDLLKKFKEGILKVIGYLVPFFQYIPNASLWYGIMSIPLISYLRAFLSYPNIAMMDFQFFFSYGAPWSYLAIFGGIFFLYSFFYQLINRKKLITKGPYKYLRHPQYVSIIITTFGFTIISLETTPVNIIFPYEIFKSSWIVYIWIAEVIAYIFLAKIEDLSLKAKYSEDFLNYAIKVPFMFPFFNLNKEKKKRKIKLFLKKL